MKRPLVLLAAGAAALVAAGSALAEPEQLEGGPYDYRMRPHVGSRRERRRTTRDRWLKSLEPKAIAAQMEHHQVAQRRTERPASRAPRT